MAVTHGSVIIRFNRQGPVVQSIVSLTSSLRGQLVKCFTTLYPNTFSHFFNKNIGIFQILTFEIFNETLTNDIVSYDQPGPDRLLSASYTKITFKDFNI